MRKEEELYHLRNCGSREWPRKLLIHRNFLYLLLYFLLSPILTPQTYNMALWSISIHIYISPKDCFKQNPLKLWKTNFRNVTNIYEMVLLLWYEIAGVSFFFFLMCHLNCRLSLRLSTATNPLKNNVIWWGFSVIEVVIKTKISWKSPMTRHTYVLICDICLTNKLDVLTLSCIM